MESKLLNLFGLANGSIRQFITLLDCTSEWETSSTSFMAQNMKKLNDLWTPPSQMVVGSCRMYINYYLTK